MITRRPCVLAGQWYPADPHELRRRVESYLAGAEPARMPAGVPRVALVPHAGYEYSGATAGKVWGLLSGHRFAAVFILAPNHRAHLERPAVPTVATFATPLGEVPIATDIVQALLATGAFVADDRAHAPEHAVEIQLPFLQVALPGVPIVPILVPSMDPARAAAAARALDRWRDAHHLLLVSSDLTHFGRDFGYVPFDEDVPARLERLDTGALLRILAHDAAGLREYGRRTGITMCGLAAASLALDDPDQRPHLAELLAYTRSADRDGDFTRSVSYAGVMICREEAVVPLSTQEQHLLVELARRAVVAAASHATLPDPSAVAAELGLDWTPALEECRGVFVTLTRDGQLRGCIGHIEGVAPLADGVIANAENAACRDPRFRPVGPDEVAALEIEVSALTPLRPVSGPEAIELGRHGIVLSRGHHRAVFLPQVAPEQGWDLETTLGQLAIKAGLGPSDWREGCRFEVFEAEICVR